MPDGSDSTGSASAEAGLRVAAQLAMSEGRAVFALVGVAAPIVLRIRELVSARLLLVNCMGVEALHDVGMDGVGAAHAVGTLGSGTLGSGTLGSGTLAGATLGSGTRAGATLGSATLAAGTFGSTPIGIVQTDDLLPLALAKFDGVAFSYAAKPQVLDQAVTVLKAGGRLVAPAECRLPAGTTELARDDREWIATRDNVPSVPIGITRR